MFRLGDDWKEYINMKDVLSITTFSLSYVFEEILDIKILLHQEDQVLAETIINLVHLVSKTNHKIEFPIGDFIINVEEIKDINSAVSLKLSATIIGGFWIWKPHYYIRMLREIDQNEYLEIYRTETSSGEKCKWKQFNVPYNMLGDKNILFNAYNSSEEYVASTSMTIEELLTPGSEFSLKQGSKIKGTLKVTWSRLDLQQNFVDYLRQGIRIKVIVAIDYTSSNLPYTTSESHHYLGPEKQNPYEASMSSVCRILDVYNKDKIIHVYGFGGIPKGQKSISHCFSLGTVKNYFELLGLYHETLPGIILSKPTNLNEVILRAQKHCEKDKNPMSYYVVLIITDGDIHDYPYTATSIVYSCRYPLSFIIVGIGNADFRNMEKLDSDNALLKDRDGRIAERDIVQFVPFNVYRRHPGLLASKVLEEVPGQICSYMKSKTNWVM
ncbi:hypothetical protein SteCoe_7728 [Stentor coeruleus]|uniref:VWFA domain-containing protein n=1 Tax=Stentor coeruleus TaxID=5963 RepID=A0A1R2CM57_9CILI|nr:hypothetical protein SteCoe_7728 [Stentor coeruleus]